jgi:hypothetical protein
MDWLQVLAGDAKGGGVCEVVGTARADVSGADSRKDPQEESQPRR